MKKILFVIPGFKHGGTNRSLLNILNCLNNENYQIAIFSMSNFGPYKDVFSKFNLLNVDITFSAIFDEYKKIINEKDFLKRNLKIIIKIIYKILRIINYDFAITFFYKRVAKKILKMNYDTVISLQEGRATHFVSYIKNVKKIAWVRCDYSEYQKIFKINEFCYYSKIDNIICVSNYTKNIFLRFFPQFENKCHAIHNMIDYINIIKDANEIIEDSLDNEFSILSIGRLDRIKNFEIIPQIAFELSGLGCKFKWYIIGNGEEKGKILEQINKYNVSKIVILLGEKNNPYPYIKKSNLLVVTSISEACPNVINEAKILHTPIVSTNFGSVYEFIDHNHNGVIVSLNCLTKNIENLIKDKETYDVIKKNLKKFNFSNEIIINEVKKLL